MAAAALPVPAHVRALLFDCDGTLVDSMPLHWRAWQETLRTFDVDVPVAFLAQLRGAIVTDMVAAVSRYCGRPIDAALFVPRKQARFRELLPGITEIKPVADLARAYAGRLPMAIVSGGCRRNVTASLRATGLLSLFPVILTADDPFPGKPAPDIMLEAARRLNVPPAACLVFEDGELGLASAAAAGMEATDIRPYLERPDAR